MSQFPRPQPVVIVGGGDWRPVSGWATAAVIMGIITLCGGFLVGIPPILAVVFGHIAIRQTRGGIRRGYGMAVTGLVLGYVFLIFGILFLVSQIANLAGVH